jgi:hypothetical protein
MQCPVHAYIRLQLTVPWIIPCVSWLVQSFLLHSIQDERVKIFMLSVLAAGNAGRAFFKGLFNALLKFFILCDSVEIFLYIAYSFIIYQLFLKSCNQ